VTNAEVRHRTGCQPMFKTIHSRRLRLFGHIERAAPEMDHCRALHGIERYGESAWHTPGPALLRPI